jgi:hypothetical protein
LHIHEAVAGKSPHGKTIVDIDKYEPIARLGGLFYCRVKEVFELPRPNEEQLSKRQQEYHEQARRTSDFLLFNLVFMHWSLLLSVSSRRNIKAMPVAFRFSCTAFCHTVMQDQVVALLPEHPSAFCVSLQTGESAKHTVDPPQEGDAK